MDMRISVTFSNGESAEYILHAGLIVLNDALRDGGILRVMRIRNDSTVPAYVNFSQVASVELLDYAGKSWDEVKKTQKLA